MIGNMRIRSIFDPLQAGGYPEGFGPTPPAPPLFNTNPMDTISPQVPDQMPMQMPNLQMQGMDWQPEHEATDFFNSLVHGMPQRQEPGMLRKIASIASGIGYGPEEQRKVLDEPYNESINQWKTQIEPAYQAANLERYANANERQVRGQTERERANRVNEDIRQQRANAYAFRIQHPDWKAVQGKGGTVHFVNPQNPEQTIDTGLDTGTMTDREKQQYGLEGELKKIEKRGDVAAGLEGLRQEGRIDIVERRGTEARSTKATPSGSATGKDLLPTQERVKQFNKAREAFNLHPEWRKFIKLGTPGSNDFEIVAPGTTLFGQWKTGPDDNAYKSMSEYIYGNKKNFNTDPYAQEPVMTNREGKTRMKTPDGRIILVPQEKIAEAQARGAQVLR